MYRNIVVGTDCSTTANRAVSKAAELAKLTGAKLHVVCAYHEPIPLASAEAPAVSFRDLAAEAIHEQTLHVEALAERLRSDGIDVETRVETGRAATMLVDVADALGAALLVVGDRGLKGAHGLLGSVPSRVTHRAVTDVLVVHTA